MRIDALTMFPTPWVQDSHGDVYAANGVPVVYLNPVDADDMNDHGAAMAVAVRAVNAHAAALAALKAAALRLQHLATLDQVRAAITDMEASA